MLSRGRGVGETKLCTCRSSITFANARLIENFPGQAFVETWLRCLIALRNEHSGFANRIPCSGSPAL